MAGFHLNVEGEMNSNRQDEIDVAGQEIQLILELPDGTVLEEAFKAGVDVAWVANVVSGKIGVRFEAVELFLGEQKLLGPMSLMDYPQIKSGATLRVAVAAEEEEQKS